MKQTLVATFDGEVLRPHEPACLEPHRAYRITVEDAKEQKETEMPEVFRRILARARDLGVGDLAAQHDYYLYGTPRR